jgi:dienelactone hydrolase
MKTGAKALARALPPLLAGAALLAAVTAAGAAEPVEFPEGGETLRGTLFRPAGPGPFPAVVALHGCGGLTAKSGAITARFRDWGERLMTAGFVVLFPDSFGSRGLGSQCTVRQRKVHASRERVNDANAARAWLQSQPWVMHERISLIGWSNGATATLWTVSEKAGKPPAGPDFHSAVAFYPGCRALEAAGWTPRMPTLILSGLADDWTPAAPCQEMAAKAQRHGAAVDIVTYPGAYHDFDVPDEPVHQSTGLAFSGDGSGTAHHGTNPAARADVITRVPRWLAR